MFKGWASGLHEERLTYLGFSWEVIRDVVVNEDCFVEVGCVPLESAVHKGTILELLFSVMR